MHALRSAAVAPTKRRPNDKGPAKARAGARATAGRSNQTLVSHLKCAKRRRRPMLKQWLTMRIDCLCPPASSARCTLPYRLPTMAALSAMPGSDLLSRPKTTSSQGLDNKQHNSVPAHRSCINIAILSSSNPAPACTAHSARQSDTLTRLCDR